MMRHEIQNQRGFSLIEVLVYLGFFTLVVGGLLLMTYRIIEGSGDLQSKVFLNEEGAFLLRKFDWAIVGASSLTVSGNDLTVTKLNLPPAESPLVFSWNSGTKTITLKRGSGSAVQLNSDSVQVTNVTFTYIAPASGKPAGIQASFTLTNLNQTQSFAFTKYLRN